MSPKEGFDGMAVYGYIRVSTSDQNTARQFAALEKWEIPKRNLYVDKQSGKDFNRPAYKKLLRKLKEGDLLYIKSTSTASAGTMKKYRNNGVF